MCDLRKYNDNEDRNYLDQEEDRTKINERVESLGHVMTEFK